MLPNWTCVQAQRRRELGVEPVTKLDLQSACQDLQSHRAVQNPMPDGLWCLLSLQFSFVNMLSHY